MLGKILKIMIYVIGIISFLVGGIIAAVAFKWLLALLMAVLAGWLFTGIMDEFTER